MRERAGENQRNGSTHGNYSESCHPTCGLDEKGSNDLIGHQ